MSKNRERDKRRKAWDEGADRREIERDEAEVNLAFNNAARLEELIAAYKRINDCYPWQAPEYKD